MECKRKDIYITTPIYYVNGKPHIGHAYTTTIADMLARFSRLAGLNTYFLTGTDEHGQKIEQSAKEKGKSPKEYADEISSVFKNLWDEFDISYDRFIRTTDDDHKRAVQKAFEIMYNKGDIYKGTYEGYYCISCETFFKKEELISDEFCPECGKPTEFIREENYFFRLSQYTDKLIAWYEENENCIIPKSKKSEVVNFVKDGLTDLSITRTSFEWGVKLPKSIDDEKHVVYVWLDALLNYISALGYGGDESKMEFWPAKVQLIGKDILRFHAIYWPAFLMSLDMPLPKHIAAHGWWTRNGEKMSKSKGNVVDPKEVADAYGVEPFKYFLLREVSFGQDGDFSQKAFIDRINSDLSNDLGNLLNRTLGMSKKYFDLKVSSDRLRELFKDELNEIDALKTTGGFLYEIQTNRYLEAIWKVLSLGNRCIDKYAPWVSMKEGREEEAKALLVLIANILYKSSILLYPAMPKSSLKLAKALGKNIDTQAYEKYVEKGELVEEFELVEIPPLFPRVDEPRLKSQTAPASLEERKKEPETPQISIDEFFKVSLKVGLIKEATEVAKSKKLLKLQVDVGEDRDRQIVAGIKEHYSADELVGKKVAVVANLKPAKLMGILSEGMILASSDECGLKLVGVEDSMSVGSSIK
ncbi:MAG: methionine--tRNA ligase [Campylobacterales bacterium]